MKLFVLMANGAVKTKNSALLKPMSAIKSLIAGTNQMKKLDARCTSTAILFNVLMGFVFLWNGSVMEMMTVGIAVMKKIVVS